VLRFEHIVPAVEVSVEENPAKKKGHMISEEHLQGFFKIGVMILKSKLS